MISCQQNQSIFCRYFNMRHYQNPAVNMRNRLATWVLFRLSFAFNFLMMFIVARTFPSLFFIIKYLSIVTTATRFVLYIHGCKALFVYEKLWTS